MNILSEAQNVQRVSETIQVSTFAGKTIVMLASKSVFIWDCIDRLAGLLVFFRKPEDDLNSNLDLEVLALKARRNILYNSPRTHF